MGKVQVAMSYTAAALVAKFSSIVVCVTAQHVSVKLLKDVLHVPCATMGQSKSNPHSAVDCTPGH